MKMLPTGLIAGLLAAALLPAFSQAQTVNICDRTPQVRDEILRQLETDDCAAVDSESLSGLSSLDLSSKGITALKAGDFAGLTSLHTLSLEHNSLTALPEGLFDGLTNLIQLVLNGNQLTALPKDLFDGLTNLRNLHLSKNRLTALPEDLFDGTTTKFILNDNSLDYKSRLVKLHLLSLIMTLELQDIFFFVRSLKQSRLQCSSFDILQYISFSTNPTRYKVATGNSFSLL